MTSLIGRRQQIREIQGRGEFYFLAADDRQVEIYAGIGAHLGNQLLAVKDLIVFQARGLKLRDGVCNRLKLGGLEVGGETGIGGLVGMNHVMVFQMRLDGESQAEAIIEAREKPDAIGGGAADHAPVDGCIDLQAPLVIMAQRKTGQVDIASQINIARLSSGVIG